MRIGFVLDGDFVNDIRVMNEASVLADSGHEIFVLNTGHNNPDHIVSTRGGVWSVKTSFTKKTRNFLFGFENLIPLYDHLWQKEISRLIKEHDIEALHAHDLFMALPAGIAARSEGIPVILDLHENYPSTVMFYRWATRFPKRLIARPHKWKQKEKDYLKYPDRIIVLSHEYRQDLLAEYDWINKESVYVYPNVPDYEKLSSYPVDREIFPSKGRKVLLYFGVISRRRGIHTAVEALAKVIENDPEIHLLLIGPVDRDEKKDFQSLFNNDCVKDHITHYNWKDISTLPSYIYCSTICLSPLIRNAQHESGIANKVFQYMMFGRPLLVSDCRPQAELVKSTSSGVVFRNGDAEDMASQLKKLLDDPGMCKTMGLKGREAIISQYNTKVQGEVIASVYKDLK